MKSGEFKIIRNRERCVVCFECIRVCPQSQPGEKYPVIVKAANLTDPPEIIHWENCIQCLNCFNTCRAMAIMFENSHMVERVMVDKYLVGEAQKII